MYLGVHLERNRNETISLATCDPSNKLWHWFVQQFFEQCSQFETCIPSVQKSNSLTWLDQPLTCFRSGESSKKRWTLTDGVQYHWPFTSGKPKTSKKHVILPKHETYETDVMCITLFIPFYIIRWSVGRVYFNRFSGFCRLTAMNWQLSQRIDQQFQLLALLGPSSIHFFRICLPHGIGYRKSMALTDILCQHCKDFLSYLSSGRCQKMSKSKVLQ